MEDSDVKFWIVPVTVILALVLAAEASPETKPPVRAADKNAGHLKMGLVNLKCVFSDSTDAKSNQANLEANLKRHLYFIDRLAAEGVEFVGFPELSVNGYHFSRTMTWLSLDGPEIAALRKKAIEKGVYISVGIAEQDADGKRWNTQVVIDPTGRI